VYECLMRSRSTVVLLSRQELQLNCVVSSLAQVQVRLGFHTVPRPELEATSGGQRYSFAKVSYCRIVAGSSYVVSWFVDNGYSRRDAMRFDLLVVVVEDEVVEKGRVKWSSGERDE
jgi:hypothetical protein